MSHQEQVVTEGPGAESHHPVLYLEQHRKSQPLWFPPVQMSPQQPHFCFMPPPRWALAWIPSPGGSKRPLVALAASSSHPLSRHQFLHKLPVYKGTYYRAPRSASRGSPRFLFLNLRVCLTLMGDFYLNGA